MKRGDHRVFFRGKKGQGLPLNTVIVAILVVLVLVVIIAFFLGGTSGLMNTIKKVFFGTTAGTDLNLAVEQCKAYCDDAKNLPPALVPSSAYCSYGFEIDFGLDGEADYCTGAKEKIAKYYCWGDRLNVACDVTIESSCGDGDPDTDYCNEGLLAGPQG